MEGRGLGGALPPELRPYKRTIDAYADSKVQAFADALVTRPVAASLPPQSLRALLEETFAYIQQKELEAQRNRELRLVIDHDCHASGCGDSACHLCQFNPSRLCKRQLKTKYLIDDHLKAKCGANLQVKLVDQDGNTVTEGPPPGMQLELCVLNGEKYKEVVPEGSLPTQSMLLACIIGHHTKALLKREGGDDAVLRCFLPAEGGRENLSELLLTTSSEALLAGKAPTFRLMLWAVDTAGQPLPHVTHAVSESFVVATKRVKHAIKSDIPSVTDGVTKLVHIGKATVDKLYDMPTSCKEEGFDLQLPPELECIENVGQFQRLVEAMELNGDLKAKIRHMLKLSPEKWEDVAAHAMSAVAPDFRKRSWTDASGTVALLFDAKHGSVLLDKPVGYVRPRAGPDATDIVVPLDQLDPATNQSIAPLQQHAVAAWYQPSHPGWSIFWTPGDGPEAAGPPIAAAPPLSLPPLSGMGLGGGGGGGMMNGYMGGDKAGGGEHAVAAAAAAQQQQQLAIAAARGHMPPPLSHTQQAAAAQAAAAQAAAAQQQSSHRKSAFAAPPPDGLTSFFPSLPAVPPLSGIPGGGGPGGPGGHGLGGGDNSLGSGLLIPQQPAAPGGAPNPASSGAFHVMTNGGPARGGGVPGGGFSGVDMFKSDQFPFLDGSVNLEWASNLAANGGLFGAGSSAAAAGGGSMAGPSLGPSGPSIDALQPPTSRQRIGPSNASLALAAEHAQAIADATAASSGRGSGGRPQGPVAGAPQGQQHGQQGPASDMPMSSALRGDDPSSLSFKMNKSLDLAKDSLTEGLV